MVMVTINHFMLAIPVLICLYLIVSKLMDYLIQWRTPAGYQRYKIYVKGRFFPIKFTGRYCRDLETDSWHYYELSNGLIWHFRKENLVGVYGDTRCSVLTNRSKNK